VAWSLFRLDALGERRRPAQRDDLFDFRALVGDVALADSLRGWLLAAAADNALFLRFMAENALRSGPPLGRIRDFVVDRESGRLDLKRDGTRPSSMRRASTHWSWA
jgi:signal-transduction protein with cAMP-binding, CBS, and nucleotidyltransferase domain